jgi:hypothetical protein
VAEALSAIQVIAGDVVSAGTHKAKAVMIAEGIPPIWSMIEGSLKANDDGSYEALEKGIEGLEAAAAAGDPAKAGVAAGIIASAVEFYQTKFPGDGKAAAAPVAAASSGERTAAAASTTAPAESKAAPTPTPAPRAADAAPAAAGAAPAAADAQPGDATLARTGGTTTPTALAGAAFGLGGLSVIAGARRRRLSATA